MSTQISNKSISSAQDIQQQNKSIQLQQSQQQHEQQGNQEDAFITDYKNNTKQSTLSSIDPQVLTIAEEMNLLVSQLEGKIDGVIEKHEAEFLIAYKNHMQKIKRELEEMKKKSDEQEKNFFAKDRISGLERQLIWFREESLRLYNKLEQKNKESDELRMQIKDLQNDKQHLEDQVKALMKKEKYMKVKLDSMKLEINQNDIVLQQQQKQNNNNQWEKLQEYQKLSEQLQQLIHFSSSDQNIKNIIDIFHGNLIENCKNDIVNCAQDIIQFVKSVQDYGNRQCKILQDKNEKLLKEKLQLTNVRSDLEQFFLECVENVKKQVIKRKYTLKEPQQIQQYMNEIRDFNIFRMEDKQKILELLLQNEKILIYIYQKLFPSQFNMHLKSILDQEKSSQIQQQVIQNQEKTLSVKNQFDPEIFQDLQTNQQQISYQDYIKKPPSSKNNRNIRSNSYQVHKNDLTNIPPLNNNNSNIHNIGNYSTLNKNLHKAGTTKNRSNTSFQLEGIINNGQKRKTGGKDKPIINNGKLLFRPGQK